jgi:glycosyltransferase involved in cell wall biosynthesis
MDGVTGILVNERDIHAMAAAISSLLADSDQAVRMGRAGRERALARFTLDRSLARLRRLLGIRQPQA